MFQEAPPLEKTGFLEGVRTRGSPRQNRDFRARVQKGGYFVTKTETKTSIRVDLLDQMQRRGLYGKQYEDLVEDYIALWDVKEKLIADIKKRGAVVDYVSNNGTTNKRKNDSVGDLLKVNGQMLKILDALGLDPEADEAAPIDDEM